MLYIVPHQDDEHLTLGSAMLADKAAGHVPHADLAVVFRFADAAPERGRVVELEARSAAGAQCLNAFRAQRAGRFCVVAS